MKIATNVHRDAFGGITISNLALFDWLERTKKTSIVGIEFIISRHLFGPKIFQHYPPSFFSHHIINAIDVMSSYSWENRGNPKKSWSQLIEATKMVLREESPDIVLINGTYFVPWILSQAAHELGIPIVLRYAGVLKKEVLHKKFLTKRRLLKHERSIAQKANATIFPSKLCQTVVETEVLGAPIKNAFVIPNPVKKMTVTGRRQKNDRYTIALIGRNTPNKNFQAFINLHKKLLEIGWPHKAIIVTSYWNKHQPFPETIERKKTMSQKELRTFYRSIDLLVVPSHFETFSNVAAEALIYGASVLVSKNTGIAEFLKKTGLGFMVIDSFENFNKSIQAVKQLSKTNVTQKQRNVLAKMLHPQRVHKDIVNVLNKVLEGNL